MEKIKELILLRGLPGSGKSTFAKSLNAPTFEADNFFMVDGEYKFNPSQISNAHTHCQNQTQMAMLNGNEKIVVSNTFTQEWEMKPYYDLANKYGYRVYSVIVENRHNGVNEHGVPADKLEIMRNRFEIKL
jgi:predicted kinase